MTLNTNRLEGEVEVYTIIFSSGDIMYDLYLENLPEVYFYSLF